MKQMILFHLHNEILLLFHSSLKSIKLMYIPLFKNANSLNLCDNTSKSNTISSNISASGLKYTFVPVSSSISYYLLIH